MRASPWRPVTGVLLCEDRVVATTILKTPFGARPAGTAEEPVETDELAAALQRMRAAGALRGKLVCGVDVRRAYAITRKLTLEEQERTPAELLASHMGLGEKMLAAAAEPVKLPGGVYTVLAACSRAVTTAAVQGLACKPGEARLIPVVHALYQQAALAAKRPRKWRTELRILPGEQFGLAILAHNGSPVASRLFDMSEDGGALPLTLAVLGLHSHGREELALPGVDGVMLHAGPEAAALATACEEATGIATRLAPLQSAGHAASSLALARAGARSRGSALDLFQDLMPPVGVLGRLPVRPLATLSAGAAILGWLLSSEAAGIEKEARAMSKAAAADCKRAHVQVADLRKVHANLLAETQIAASFLTSRLRWGELLRALPEVLPPSMTIADFDGRDQVRYPSKRKSDLTGKGRQLALSGEVPLSAADSSPPEVAEFTDSIRASSAFQKYLPQITGANVRLLPAVKGLSARISVQCLPDAGGGK